MRKLIIVFFLLHISISFSQTKDLTTEFLNDILKNSTYTAYNKPKIISKLDSAHVEFNLNRLIGKKNRTFVAKMKNSKDSIRQIKLTKSEKTLLINSVRQQYKQYWNKEDFKGYEMINLEESLAYLKSDRKNTLVNISNPIFFRNDEFAFAYFSNFCCLDCGHIELAFYKKQDGIWKIWIYVSAGDF